MGLFDRLGKKNIDKVVDSGIKGIDKLFFTNEEKAEFNKSMADSVVEFVKTTVDESSIRSMTRRFIAFAVVFVYLLTFIGAIVVAFVAQDMTTFMMNMVKELSAAFIMVLAFYFGGYYASKFIGSKRGKKDA